MDTIKIKNILLMCMVFFSSCVQLASIKTESGIVYNNPTIATKALGEDEFIHNKKAMDSVLLKYDHSSVYKWLGKKGEIRIGHLFSTSSTHAVIAYQTNDSILQVEILVKKGQLWDTVVNHQTRCYFSDMLPFSEIIEITDFDGDQISDLRLIDNSWDIHPGNTGDLWLYKNGTFEFVEGFDQVVSPVYHQPSNRIYSYETDGCADMYMVFGVYKIENNKTIEEDFLDCDCCDYEQGNCIVTRNGKGDSVDVSKVHLQVPLYYREAVKEKVKL